MEEGRLKPLFKILGLLGYKPTFSCSKLLSAVGLVQNTATTKSKEEAVSTYTSIFPTNVAISLFLVMFTINKSKTDGSF